MTYKHGKTFVLLLVSSLFVLWAGCGSDDEGDDDKDSDDEQTNWLVREKPTESPFVSSTLEAVLDDLVEALNKESKDTSFTMGFVPKDMSDYWQITNTGANRAAAELGVMINILAPEAQDDQELKEQQQTEYLEQLVEDGVSAIGVAPHNNEQIEAMDKAVEEGKVVVTFDSDQNTSKRHFYVGTINSEAGKTAGQTLLQLIGSDKTGTVIILGHDEDDWPDGRDRTFGARDVLEAAGHTVVIRKSDWEDQSTNTAFMKEALENADPPAVGLLGMFSNAHLCATAAEEAGVIDDVKIAAFDFDSLTLSYMGEGKIQATHVQNQYYMGYLTPYILYAASVLGVEETKKIMADILIDNSIVNTGFNVVVADQLEEYQDYLDALAI